MNTYTCRSYRSGAIRFYSLRRGRIYSFKDSRFSSLVSLKIAPSIRFKKQEIRFVGVLVIYQIRSYPGLKTGVIRPFLRYTKFKGNVVNRVNLIPYVSKGIKQDLDYWIIDKADLAEVSLIPKDNNSLGEFVLSFILYLNHAKVEPRLIKTFFYKHIVFEENGQFYEIQSFLIDWINTLPTNKLPSKL